MGIIGKTHGVKRAKNPIDNARRTKGKKPLLIASSRLKSPVEEVVLSVFGSISVNSALVDPETTLTFTCSVSRLGG